MANVPHRRPQPQPDHAPALGCQRYASCSAGFCPAIGGVHRKSEPVCLWLREAVKSPARSKIGTAYARNLAEVVSMAAAHLLTQRGALAEELRRAARHGSQTDSGRRLQAAHQAADGGAP
jgi:hypothetical protein